MKEISAKTIATSTPNGWFGSDYNMNIYKGCCHGCIYCDSRSECYRIENFDEVRAKGGAVEMLERELRGKRKSGVIATGAMSDPYNPKEEKYELTRAALKVIDQYHFGVSVITKSDLIKRDVDLYRSIATHSPVFTRLTITTYEDSLCKKIEPRVALTSKRLKAMEVLAKEGVFTGTFIVPLLPFINDFEENIINIVKGTVEGGGKFVYLAFGVTLRQNQRAYFYQQIDKLFPGVKEKYIKTFGEAYQCTSPNAKDLWKVFVPLCEKYKLLYKMEDIIRAYKSPYEIRQLSLF